MSLGLRRVDISSVTRGRVPLTLGLCLLFALLVWPVIAWQGGGTSEAGDQGEFHEPTVRAISSHWPSIELDQYRTATAPGYHLALATVARWLDDRTATLQVVGSLFGLGLLVSVFVPASRALGPGAAVALILPLVCSKFVLGSAIWMTTDNAALWFVWLALSGAVLYEATPGRVARWSLWATLAVLVRQIHLWVAAPVWLAAISISPAGGWISRLLEDRRQPRFSWKRWLPVVPALLGPLAVLAMLVAAWGGLVPPLFQRAHVGGQNPVTLLVALSLFGAFGVFFLPAFASWRELTRPDRPMWLAILAGLGVSLLWTSERNVAAGCWGGPIWRVAAVMPTIAGRSVVFVPLACLGAAVLLSAWRALRRAGRVKQGGLLFLSLIGWAVTQSMNHGAWQRYCEPVVLIALILITILCRAGRLPDGQAENDCRWTCGRPASAVPWWTGLLVLAALQFAVSLLTVYWPAWHEGLPAVPV